MAPAQPAPPPPAKIELHAMRVNGTVLSYRLAGDQGTPVVFVHGSYGDMNDWNTQINAFARTHRVLAYSRRYHPPNPPQNDGQVYSPQLHADDLAALLAVLGHSPAHIVGAGYGAYVALALAIEHPELVRTLVLGEPPALPFLLRSPAGDSLRRALIATTLDPARAAFARGDSVGALRLFVDGMADRRGYFRQPPPGDPRTAHRPLRSKCGASCSPTASNTCPHSSAPTSRQLAMPVLLLQGERSPRMFHVITAELDRCLQSDTVITIPGAGHAINESNPVVFNQTVLQYLATH